MSSNEAHEHLGKIAVVGMAVRLPGAKDVDQFWRNLRDGVESVKFFSDEELAAEGIPEYLLRNPKYVKAGATLDDIDMFDAPFFGIHAREAQLMDPQHRLFLECAWESLENAGYNPQQYEGRIGVYASESVNTYFLVNVQSNRDVIESMGAVQTVLNNDRDFLATRVSFLLNLRGPAIVVQSACSSSLVAVHLACQSLNYGDCDMALAGGVAIRLPQMAGYMYAEGSIFSSDGHCRPFDAKASGTLGGNGAGIVVLKRLADALRDGDEIRAVIRGSAINNDGSVKIGYTAPSVDGQSKAIAEALAIAGVEPDTIDYVETHGTATPLGDPIEVEALTQAYRYRTAKKSFCAIGSLKSNLGHLDAAAGAGSLIKTVLALQNKQIPPSLNFETPNPKIDFANSPFYVNATLAPWEKPSGNEATPRRAGVSSFGIGGTNVHVVVEEAPARQPAHAPSAKQLLVLSAKTASALESETANLLGYLKAHPDAQLADVAFTLQSGRYAFNHRRMLVAGSVADAVAALETKNYVSRTTEAHDASIVFMFPGQGTQHVNMGRELYDGEPVFRVEVDRCAEVLERHIGIDLRKIIYPVPEQAEAAEQQLTQTSLTQPALFVIEYALAKVLESRGLKPAAMIGHSLGEYVAACLSGVFSLEDALMLVAVRGRMMQALPAGAMLSVQLPEAEVAALLNGRLSIAAVNGSSLCTVSGPLADIESLHEQLTGRGVSCRRLKTSHAFHSAMMNDIMEPFARQVQNVSLSAPRVPYVSNLTGRWIEAREATDPRYWIDHLRHAVRFADGVSVLLREQQAVLLEVGPGQVLTTLTKLMGAHADKTRGHEAIPALPVMNAIGRLWLAGVDVDWTRLHNEQRRRVSLPTYPFERQRYWLDPVKTTSSAVPVTKIVETPTVSGEHKPPADKQAVWPTLKTAIAELTGSDAAQIDPKATFFELGVDSLLLIQAAQLIEKRFGVEISFRQLLEEYSTLEALASFLERRGSVADEPKVEREPEAFVPFHAVETKPADGLTPQQRQSLDEFITRYTTRTKKSQEIIQSSRRHHADSRFAVNYRQTWKDLVYPLVGERSRGSRLWDADGNEYVDLTMGFGVHLFGHSPGFLVEALQRQLSNGFQLGPLSSLAGEAAELFCELTHTDRAAFCNSGTEAVMAAIRLARAATGRNKIAIFAGSYHGSFDGILARGVRENGQLRAVPVAPGVPPGMIADVMILDYDRPESLEAIQANAHELAAVLVEPVQSRRPDLQPAAFLRALREITKESGTVLIFDEVITGFRLHQGGAQAWFGIDADLATYGKVIGGGVPIGVVAGKSAVIDAIDGGNWTFGDDSFPSAKQTYYAGTYFKNPLAMAAAVAVLKHLKASGPTLHQELNARTSAMAARFDDLFASEGLPIRVVNCASLFRFDLPRVVRFADLFFYHLVEKGIYIWEGRNCFLSTAHTDADIDLLFNAVERTVAEMKAHDFLPSSGVAAGKNRRFPLTEGQQQVWLASQIGHAASVAYNESMTLSARGKLDVEAMRRAIEKLVNRHDSLRTVFGTEGDYQEIIPHLKTSVPLVDFSDLDQPHRDREFAGWMKRETQQPFDLAQGPLMRAHLVRLEVEHHLLVMTVHHIVMDGWSASVLFRDLRELYDAECKGIAAPLPPPESYTQFAERLDRQDESEEMARAEAFWLGQYADGIPVLNLPLDRPRGAVQTFNGDRERSNINGHITGDLKQLSADHSCTTFVTLLAALNVLLYSISKQNDFIAGIHSAGQLTTNARDLVGYCINLLPVRTRVDAELGFAEYLDQLKAELLDVYSHQNYPLGRLIKKLNPPRDPSRAPLIAVTINVDRVGEKTNFHGLEVEAVANHNGHSKFDLSLNLIESAEKLEVEADYNTDLFDAETIQRWLSYFEMMLLTLLANPTVKIRELKNLVDESEEHYRRLKEEEFKGSRRQKLKQLKRRVTVQS